MSRVKNITSEDMILDGLVRVVDGDECQFCGKIRKIVELQFGRKIYLTCAECAFREIDKLKLVKEPIDKIDFLLACGLLELKSMSCCNGVEGLLHEAYICDLEICSSCGGQSCYCKCNKPRHERYPLIYLCEDGENVCSRCGKGYAEMRNVNTIPDHEKYFPEYERHCQVCIDCLYIITIFIENFRMYMLEFVETYKKIYNEIEQNLVGMELKLLRHKYEKTGDCYGTIIDLSSPNLRFEYPSISDENITVCDNTREMINNVMKKHD